VGSGCWRVVPAEERQPTMTMQYKQPTAICKNLGCLLYFCSGRSKALIPAVALCSCLSLWILRNEPQSSRAEK